MLPPNKIAVFIDYDNIKMNMKTNPPEKLAEGLGYERLKSWLSKTGEIVAIFIFAPAVTIFANIEFFYKLGFIPIACPMLPQKVKEERVLYGIETEKNEELRPINKTDEVLINVAETIINLMPDITHICIASGDHHFIPVAKLAKSRGKKVMIVIGSYRPSKKFLDFADRDQLANRRMIYLFNPIRD